MKNVNKTLEVSFDLNELKDELVSVLEDFVLDALQEESVETLSSRMTSVFDQLEDEVRQKIDFFLEQDVELEVDQYLDKPDDGIEVNVTYDAAACTLDIDIKAEIEDRVEQTDFNKLIAMLNDLGLNLADKTAILKIAKDAGVE